MLALYLCFAVLRPLLRRYLQPALAQPLAATAPDAMAGNSSEPGMQAQDRENQRHLDNTQYARETAVKDPRMVAMLIKHWMEQKNG